MRAVLLMLFLAGCAERAPDYWEQVGVDLSEVEGGAYRANVHVLVRAFMGPVVVARSTCDRVVDFRVVPGEAPVISASFACDLPEAGRVQAAVDGRTDVLPWIDGDVAVRIADEPPDETIVLPWDGGFIDGATLFGELAGEDEYEGKTVKFEGWFLAERQE